MKNSLRIAIVASIVLLGGCYPVIEHFYVPVEYDSEESDWVCGGVERPEYTIELAENIDLVVSTLGHVNSTIFYLNVVTRHEVDVELGSYDIPFETNNGDVVIIEFLKQSWSVEKFNKKYGDYYQFFTANTELVEGETKITLHLPPIHIGSQVFNVEPIAMFKNSSLGIDFCGLGSP